MVYIYKIYCKDKDIEDVYIGSTKNITLRITDHKHCCNNENNEKYNQYKYIFIRENGGFNNWTYDIICECTSEDRFELERWYIENTKSTNLNKNIPTRTDTDLREYNKEYAKQYTQLNKNKMKENQKKYRELNKDTIKEKNKKWRDLNKEKIKENREYNKEKYECECGSKLRKADKARHNKSKKHVLFISSKAVCD